MTNIKFVLIFFLFIQNVSLADWWGAIYLDYNTGIAGGATDAATRIQAEQVAKNSCIDKHKKRKISHKCELVVYFANSCGAVNWSSDKKVVGWAHSVFSNNAKNEAYNECVRLGGKQCQLSMSICNTRIIY